MTHLEPPHRDASKTLVTRALSPTVLGPALLVVAGLIALLGGHWLIVLLLLASGGASVLAKRS